MQREEHSSCVAFPLMRLGCRPLASIGKLTEGERNSQHLTSLFDPRDLDKVFKPSFLTPVSDPLATV